MLTFQWWTTGVVGTMSQGLGARGGGGGGGGEDAGNSKIRGLWPRAGER